MLVRLPNGTIHTHMTFLSQQEGVFARTDVSDPTLAYKVKGTNAKLNFATHVITLGTADHEMDSSLHGCFSGHWPRPSFMEKSPYFSPCSRTASLSQDKGKHMHDIVTRMSMRKHMSS